MCRPTSSSKAAASPAFTASIRAASAGPLSSCDPAGATSDGVMLGYRPLCGAAPGDPGPRRWTLPMESMAVVRIRATAGAPPRILLPPLLDDAPELCPLCRREQAVDPLHRHPVVALNLCAGQL